MTQLSLCKKKGRPKYWGGNNPPTLLITTQFREEHRVHLNGTEIVHDTTVYYVDIKFELKNDSKYFIKSVFSTIDGLDYSNQALLNFRLRGEWFNMLDLQNTDRQNTFPFNTISPGKSKYFVERIPFGGRHSYRFKIDVEWTNGEYIADLELWSNEAVDLKNLTRENFGGNKFKLNLKKIDFKTLRGKKLPSYKFTHDERLNFNFIHN